MAKTQQNENSKEQAEQQRETQKRDALNSLVGKQVITLMGVPEGLNKVQVRRLWENYYRVNILTGPDASSVKVSSSFFLQADGEGNIVTSSPKIMKQGAAAKTQVCGVS